MDLQRTVDRIQSLVSAETGRRLGTDAEAALSQLLRNGAIYPQRNDGFTRRELTILFADLRGFMAISNRYPPETVLQVLNRCLVTMIEVVFAHEGTIDKFMGDSIMAHFSETPPGKDPAQRAVACALELQLAMDALNAQHRDAALRELLEIPSLGKAVPRREIRKGPRINVALPFSYQVIQADVTMPQVHKGVVRVLGYHGLLAELREPLAVSDEIKIRVDLPLVGHRASDIYGRVKKSTKGELRYFCGIEFTAITGKTRSSIELLVQILMQTMESD